MRSQERSATSRRHMRRFAKRTFQDVVRTVRSAPRAGLKACTTSCLAAGLALVAFATVHVQAHKPITSKYTYNDDVFSIFRDRCGRCHIAGGAAPMSLLTYKDALPWAESIREELIAERMPPSYVDVESAPVTSSGSVRPLTAREIDTVITWATGGTPEGPSARRTEPEPFHADWRSGRPDLVISMDTEYTVPPDTQEDTREFLLPTGLPETRWVKAADLRPGTPSIVRDASISVDGGAVLALWVPGDEPAAAPEGTAFRLAAGARLRLRIHYKKSWQDERSAKSDKSALGLYFTSAPTSDHELRAMNVEPERRSTPDATAPEIFGRDVAQPLTIVGVRPALDRPYAVVDVHARLPDGVRVPLLRLHAPRPEWTRRYWLARAIDLPAGSRLEVSATPTLSDADLFPAGARAPASSTPLQIRLDVVSK